MNATRLRKPNLLVVLTVFVGLSVLATGIAQAGEPYALSGFTDRDDGGANSEHWWQTIWGLDLARKLKNWRPRITPAEHGEGFHLARPFGTKGPMLQFSSSQPESVLRGLRAGGDTGVGGIGGDTDLYLFLQKRW